MSEISQKLKPSVVAPILPNPEEIAVLGFFERLGFKLTHQMNHGEWKRFWSFCQRHIGSLWIKIATYNLITVFDIENIENSDSERPVLLVANHRSFFDMYVVSSAMFRETSRPINLFFPVRGKFFYNNPIGWVVNLLMGWWSMYPPFFRESREAEKRGFDKYAMRRLIQICSEGKANVIGFHPEGKRNLTDNPYAFARAQPGVGKIIMEASPQVIPVFIAGLGNNLPKQILGNWTGGEKIRVWFGEEIELSEFYEQKNSRRTHKKIADFIMTKVADLSEKDKKLFAGK